MNKYYILYFLFIINNILQAQSKPLLYDPPSFEPYYLKGEADLYFITESISGFGIATGYRSKNNYAVSGSYHKNYSNNFSLFNGYDLNIQKYFEFGRDSFLRRELIANLNVARLYHSQKTFQGELAYRTARNEYSFSTGIKQYFSKTFSVYLFQSVTMLDYTSVTFLYPISNYPEIADFTKKDLQVIPKIGMTWMLANSKAKLFFSYVHVLGYRNAQYIARAGSSFGISIGLTNLYEKFRKKNNR